MMDCNYDGALVFGFDEEDDNWYDDEEYYYARINISDKD